MSQKTLLLATITLCKRAFHGSVQLLKAMSKNKVIRWVANGLMLIFCVSYLLRFSQSIVIEIRNVHLNGWWLAAAFLLTEVIVLTGALSWWLLLRGFGQTAGLLEGVYSHINPLPGKYVPGYVWQYVGKAYLTQQFNVPNKVIGALLVWEQVQLIWAGLGVGLLFFPRQIMNQGSIHAGAFVNFMGAIILLSGIAFLFFTPKLFAFLKFGEINFRKWYLLLSALVIILNWLLLGITTWMTTTAFRAVPLEVTTYLFYISAVAVSLVAGLLVIFVPYGIGVREGVMIYMLNSLLPMPISLLTATFSRFEIVVAEITSAIFFIVSHQLHLYRKQKKNREYF